MNVFDITASISTTTTTCIQENDTRSLITIFAVDCKDRYRWSIYLEHWTAQYNWRNYDIQMITVIYRESQCTVHSLNDVNKKHMLSMKK